MKICFAISILFLFLSNSCCTYAKMTCPECNLPDERNTYYRYPTILPETPKMIYLDYDTKLSLTHPNNLYSLLIDYSRMKTEILLLRQREQYYRTEILTLQEEDKKNKEKK